MECGGRGHSTHFQNLFRTLNSRSFLAIPTVLRWAYNTCYQIGSLHASHFVRPRTAVLMRAVPVGRAEPRLNGPIINIICGVWWLMWWDTQVGSRVWTLS